MNPHGLAARGDHAGLWDWNLATNRVHFSPRWISMVGSDEHHVGNTPDAWLGRVHPDDIGEVRRQIDEHLAGGTSEFDLPHRLLHRDGTYRWTVCHAVVVRHESGQPVRLMGSHSDVTAEKVADALTGLPNRLLFMDHLERALERSKRNPAHRFAVLLLDLGLAEPHEGEALDDVSGPLLTAAARRLETCLRAGGGGPSLSRDHLVARMSGDEFAILLDGLAEIGDARAVADRVLGDVQSALIVDGDECFLSPSIGIAVSATGYTRAESVMRDADTALHRARLLGRARCEVFDTAVVKSAQTERKLHTDFTEALARGEFLLVFQPVVSLATQRVAGFEALIRWQHPTRGLLSPLEFIPIAEKTGFIVPLGQWTLREACLQLKAWQASVPAADHVWVSVNLSVPQFSHPSLVNDIAQVLSDVGLSAQSLVVELTEGVAMENPAAVKSVLMELRVMGVRVALDDFGTGQSSLAYLHQFPTDKLKLDRSFIADMESHRDVREIVGAVTALAHQLGLEVIAEGVETAGQLAQVRALGCEYVQGFFFSKPVNKDLAAELLRSGFQGRADIEPAPALVAAAPAVECPPHREAAGKRSRMSKALYVSAAAVVTLALAGLVAHYLPAPSPPATSASPTALDRTAEAPGPPPLREPARADVPSSIPPAAATAKPGSSSAPAAKAVEYSFPLVHRHALRGCRGRLTVSSRGVAFVPDKAEDRAKDAFALKYSEFRSAVSGDELTVTSPARTYRFKAADEGSKDARRTFLQGIQTRIARLRAASPAK